MKPGVLAVVVLSAFTGVAVAQTAPTLRESAPAAKPVKPKPATAKQPAPAFDPYEKARKAQAEFFRREAEENEKRREKEAGENRFYRKPPPSTPAGATGLAVPMGRF